VDHPRRRRAPQVVRVDPLDARALAGLVQVPADVPPRSKEQTIHSRRVVDRVLDELAPLVTDNGHDARGLLCLGAANCDVAAFKIDVLEACTVRLPEARAGRQHERNTRSAIGRQLCQELHGLGLAEKALFRLVLGRKPIGQDGLDVPGELPSLLGHFERSAQRAEFLRHRAERGAFLEPLLHEGVDCTRTDSTEARLGTQDAQQVPTLGAVELHCCVRGTLGPARLEQLL